jgi:hypothetical protein
VFAGEEVHGESFGEIVEKSVNGFLHSVGVVKPPLRARFRGCGFASSPARTFFPIGEPDRGLW